MKRLGLTTVAVGASWAVLHTHPTQPNDPYDGVIITVIAIVFLLAALIMLIGTPRWSARSLGLLLTTLGTGTVYSVAAYSRYIGPPQHREGLIDLARSFYVVGGPLLAYGIAMWVHVNWGPPSRVTSDDYTGPERRSGAPGRRSSDYDRAEL